MKLFAYYVWHSFINALKKVLKTWVAFMLILIVFGGLVGFIFGTVIDSIEENEPGTEDVIEGGDLPEDYEDIDIPNFFESTGITQENLLELIVTGFFLLMIFLSLFGGKELGTIFQPADVAMLFPAPVRPQSVMMFRLVASLGTQIMISLIMILQIPNLIHGFGLTVWGAVSLIIAWVLLNVLIILLQVFLYILSSHSSYLKKNSRMLVLLVFGAILAVFVFVLLQNDRNVWKSLVITFTGAGTYWIPFWGWLRGFCMNAIGGNLAMCFLFLGIYILGLVAMFIAIYYMKVDFYEDAVVSAERVAAAMEKAKNTKNVMQRDKDRSDKLNRDGFKYGHGANVFFFKTLYNRFRLSMVKGITKTMILYALIATGMIVLYKVLDMPFAFLITCLVLTMTAFYRSLGNALHEDTSKEFFLMVPASAGSKLFWSLLGGLTNTALDLIIPYAVVAVVMQAGIAEAIFWFLFILTIDLYGTTIGCFVELSITVNLPESIQKMVQIIFIYFGILPAIVLIVIGIVLQNVALFLPFGIIANLVLTALFFFLTPLFLQNGRR